MCLVVGDVIKTSYAEDPLRVICVSEICTFPDPVNEIEGDESPSPEHYHIVCVDTDEPLRDHHTDYHMSKWLWLGGYNKGATGNIYSVWNERNSLEVLGVRSGAQLSMI